MKATKESLTKENKSLGSEIATLRQTVERLESSDRRLRGQFTKVMGGDSNQSGNGWSFTAFTVSGSRESYSWEEIFCELGKLLSQRAHGSLTARLNLLEERVGEIQKQPKAE